MWGAGARRVGASQDVKGFSNMQLADIWEKRMGDRASKMENRSSQGPAGVYTAVLRANAAKHALGFGSCVRWRASLQSGTEIDGQYWSPA